MTVSSPFAIGRITLMTRSKVSFEITAMLREFGYYRIGNTIEVQRSKVFKSHDGIRPYLGLRAEIAWETNTPNAGGKSYRTAHMLPQAKG